MDFDGDVDIVRNLFKTIVKDKFYFQALSKSTWKTLFQFRAKHNVDDRLVMKPVYRWDRGMHLRFAPFYQCRCCQCPQCIRKYFWYPIRSVESNSYFIWIDGDDALTTDIIVYATSIFPASENPTTISEQRY